MAPAAKGPRVKPGDLLPVWRFGPVDPAAMRTLAELLNDPNPIHLDAAAAAAAGLGDRAINQGPANLAYALNMLEAAGLELVSLEARFTGNVRAGDHLTVRGRVESCEGEELRCAFEVLVEDDDASAISGVANCRKDDP